MNINIYEYRSDFTDLERTCYIAAVVAAARAGQPLECASIDNWAVDGSWDPCGLSPDSIEQGKNFRPNWLAYRIAKPIVTPPAAPKIASGHNPAKLTEDQVGVKDGWRLLEIDELWKRCHERDDGIEFFSGYEWYKRFDYVEIHGDWAFRTKNPLGHYLPKPKVLHPWTFDTAPKGYTLVKTNGGRLHAQLVVSWGLDAVRVGNGNDANSPTYQELLDNYVHSTDCGKTWSPCGILE